MLFKKWEDKLLPTEFFWNLRFKISISQSAVTSLINNFREFWKIWILCHPMIQSLNWSLENILIREIPERWITSHSVQMLIDQRICSQVTLQRDPNWIQLNYNSILKRPKLKRDSLQVPLEKSMCLRIDFLSRLSTLQMTPLMLNKECKL